MGLGDIADIVVSMAMNKKANWQWMLVNMNKREDRLLMYLL